MCKPKCMFIFVQTKTNKLKTMETKHEKLMRRLNKVVELHDQAQLYDLSERRERLRNYLHQKRNNYLRELYYTPIEHSEQNLPF